MDSISCEKCKKLGHRIKVRRVAMAMTQTQLAQRVGIQQAHLSVIERGRIRLHADRLVTIAQALKCPAGYLLGEIALDPNGF